MPYPISPQQLIPNKVFTQQPQQCKVQVLQQRCSNRGVPHSVLCLLRLLALHAHVSILMPKSHAASQLTMALT